MLALRLIVSLLVASAGASEPAAIPSPSIESAAQSATSSKSGVKACAALRRAGLADRLLSPTDDGYDAQIATWWAENARLRPACLVLPRTAQEVSTAWTTLARACPGGWHVAVRSGGHGWPGASNTAGGVTIDLSMMNRTAYDPETNVASIQPGGHWKDVYADLEKQGVVVAGGRDGGVGVGGFLLGGGLSFYSGRTGFGCDSVVNFEVVLANGTIVNANRTAHADLWRALKGGGSNFGIVTRFDMEAIPSQDMYYHLRFLDSRHSETVVETVVAFAAAGDYDLADDGLVTFFSHDTSVGPEPHVGVIHANTRGHDNVSAVFEKLNALPALSEVAAFQSMAEAAAGSQLPAGKKNAGTTLTLRNDPEILRRCVELHGEYVEKLKRHMNPDSFTTMMLLQPLPSYVTAIGQVRGGNVLGLDGSENMVLWTGGVAVDADAGEGAFALAQGELRAMTARVKKASRKLGADMDFVYLNYADASQDPLGSYGAANVQYLRDVAVRYDPAGIFQSRVPGGFKISKVV